MSNTWPCSSWAHLFLGRLPDSLLYPNQTICKMPNFCSNLVQTLPHHGLFTYQARALVLTCVQNLTLTFRKRVALRKVGDPNVGDLYKTAGGTPLRQLNSPVGGLHSPLEPGIETRMGAPSKVTNYPCWEALALAHYPQQTWSTRAGDFSNKTRVNTPLVLSVEQGKMVFIHKVGKEVGSIKPAVSLL